MRFTMSQSSIKEMKKFIGKYIRLNTENHNDVEGIYLGSWLDNHITYIHFNHQTQTANIEHISHTTITNIHMLRDISSEEKRLICEYMGKKSPVLST